jgi:stalled ribosome alternative rescue factor ArfA
MASKKKKPKIPKRRSAVLASLSDPMFRKRVEKKRKGKGSYTRNQKHKGKGYDLSQLIVSLFRS